MGASLVAVAVVGLLHLGRRVLLTTRLGTGLFTGYCDLVRSLFSSGEERRIESGIWMYAALLVVLLGPCWIFLNT